MSSWRKLIRSRHLVSALTKRQKPLYSQWTARTLILMPTGLYSITAQPVRTPFTISNSMELIVSIIYRFIPPTAGNRLLSVPSTVIGRVPGASTVGAHASRYRRSTLRLDDPHFFSLLVRGQHSVMALLHLPSFCLTRCPAHTHGNIDEICSNRIIVILGLCFLREKANINLQIDFKR